MTQFVVWMDSEKAHLFNLKTSEIEKSHLGVHGADHHTRNKKDLLEAAHMEHFYRDLAAKLKDADQILILGPGLSKNHFKTYLEKHHTAGLASKIVGMESSDHPTDNQIIAFAKKFFTAELLA
jgi:stalled ribosome rescue protein Dom34